MSQILLRTGIARSDQGDDGQALRLFGEAESIERALLGHPRLPDVLIERGAALWGRGEYDQAIGVADEAVQLEGEGKGRSATLAAAYVNLGTAYWSKSDYDEGRLLGEGPPTMGFESVHWSAVGDPRASDDDLLK